MTYLDTGCLVKLYYPEQDSPKVVALVQGKPLCHTSLHALEFTNALQLKAFAQSATAAQVEAARSLVDADLKSGVLISCDSAWQDIFAESVALANKHTASIGCRSLDVLHYAVAHSLSANEFVTTDSRQRRLALAMGLNVVTF